MKYFIHILSLCLIVSSIFPVNSQAQWTATNIPSGYLGGYTIKNSNLFVDAWHGGAFRTTYNGSTWIDNNSTKQSDDFKYHSVTDSGIRKCLNEMNEALATKDLQKVMGIYDNSDDIIVVGSDSGEVFIGKKRVEVFMKIIVSMPFIFSFDMDNALIQQDNNIAWVFIDTKMVHTKENGKSSMIPYRITGVLVKKGSDWKWRLFSGSIPRGE